MDDLISRQAAVDAIYHHLPSVSRMEARLMLHEVPSAEPEIIYCGECAKMKVDTVFHDCWCGVYRGAGGSRSGCKADGKVYGGRGDQEGG